MDLSTAAAAAFSVAILVLCLLHLIGSHFEEESDAFEWCKVIVIIVNCNSAKYINLSVDNYIGRIIYKFVTVCKPAIV